ncbi:MAG: Arsenical pump-driving ATPase, partial [Acidobacteria bacterium]|nr:Arsenical pump-driving ATPase [Acidobacteriota bacterium]
MFYAGKGGVGKTTTAAAYAIAAPRRDRVLLVSTDPAHSLGDALGIQLSGTPKRIRPSLDAVELDAPRAFARWLQEHRRPLGEILEHGTWLDREDVEALLELSIPGVDELMGMLEIDRLAHQHRSPRADRGQPPPASYDRIVVDTAPTGHTLRLLSAPETVAAVAEVLADLQQEHRLIREQLARVGRPEAADRLIAVLAEQAREMAQRLRDPDRTAFVWVTLPEELSFEETADGIAALERAGIRVGDIVVNRVLPDGGPCPVCDRRRADERRTTAAIRRRFARGRVLRLVPATPREPRGIAALTKLAAATADGSWPTAGGARAVDHRPSAISHQRSALAVDTAALFAGASLLFFGGKGGVGKTTASAAVALRLARADPARRVLLLSTDPAHSLGDVFRAEIGDSAGAVPGGPANLIVRELDAAAALARRRAEFEGALDEIAAAVGIGGASINASGLMNLAPPGIDELFGVLSVVDARADYDVIVVDTAPTGHALRLLEMPAAAREWTRVLLRVLLKYRSLVRPGQLAAELVEVSKSIRDLIALLRDATTTRFVVVTRAAELPRRETIRLLARLRRLHLSAPAIVVNARTLAPGRCAHCR